ncbi:alpha/beta fold hydrolase [Granulicoccus sp. GXG6511]|uniref:alpha/beta fold hydrolase n=1 Tax=Granulicoccus sp. GXG6511 TaxID=3381351 RepID=UPI003D7DFC98
MANELAVFLHGLGQTPQTWQDQVRDLPSDLPAAAPWLRGLRPGSQNRFSLRDSAAEVSSALTMHGAGRAYLIGLSLGAMVALQTAADDERVAGLVLSAPQVNPPRWLMKMQGAALKLASRRRLADRGLNKDAMQDVFHAMAETDFADRLHEITQPVLILCGDRDRANLQTAKLLADQLPHGRLAVVPGGHQLNTDNAAEFNRLTYEFLAELRQL